VVHCEAGPEEAAGRAAALLAEAVEEALAQRGAAHLALSGGSTPRRAYELLGPLVDDWRGVHVWFADERCVGPDDPESNARLVRETLAAPGARVHRIEGERGAEAAAEACERALGDVVLDVVLLGLGPDGHTASLFPGHAALEAPGRAAPVHDAPKPPPDRVTLTRATLDGARRRVLLVTGADKARALAGALGPPTPAVPASLLRRDDLDVVVDPPALGA
jgi:6-phosphogluconolactonase